MTSQRSNAERTLHLICFVLTLTVVIPVLHILTNGDIFLPAVIACTAFIRFVAPR